MAHGEPVAETAASSIETALASYQDVGILREQAGKGGKRWKNGRAADDCRRTQHKVSGDAQISEIPAPGD
jgi:hypothetical protein